MNTAIEFLNKNNIDYERFDHRAVYTCDEANEVIPDLAGARTKNLFLRNKKGDRYFLLVLSEEKAIDLTALSKQLGSSRFTFASAERLKEHLAVEPGSVSLLAIMNDTDAKVELIIDADVWAANAVLCHPLVNTSTLILAMDQVKTFLGLLNKSANIMTLPIK